MNNVVSKVAVVGSGISGAVCASTLARNGVSVTVFDSARGPGGRMSQRREISEDGKELLFDHGAPFFAVSNADALALVHEWESGGLVAEWKVNFGSYDCISKKFVDGQQGLAFQLIDDVLDFTGTSTSLGKGSLSDIRHGIVTAPILFAMEEFPQLRAVVDQGFEKSSNVDIALEYLGKSQGIQRTRELAMKHADLAAATIDSLPESDDKDVRKSRRALIDLTQIVISRNK